MGNTNMQTEKREKKRNETTLCTEKTCIVILLCLLSDRVVQSLLQDKLLHRTSQGKTPITCLYYLITLYMSSGFFFLIPRKLFFISHFELYCRLNINKIISSVVL